MDDNVHAEPPNTEPRPAPVMDIMPPTNDKAHESSKAYSSPPAPSHQDLPKPTAGAQPTQSNQANGTTAAITATVIIVLVLAVLATYAYIKTK